MQKTASLRCGKSTKATTKSQKRKAHTARRSPTPTTRPVLHSQSLSIPQNSALKNCGTTTQTQRATIATQTKLITKKATQHRHSSVQTPSYLLNTPSRASFGSYLNPDFHNTDYSPTGRPIHRATTILCVRKDNSVVMIGDGQVSLGPTVVKPNAKKIRRIGTNNDVVVGFAGSTADAFTLLQLLENQLEQFPGQLLRASVETAKLWRTDKMSRHLEAMLIASDENISLCISGNGDVIESHDGLLGIGSGSTYALAAARALIDIDGFDSMMIAKKAMNIAADICVYTNHNFVIDQIAVKPSPDQANSSNTFAPGNETGLSSPIPPGGVKDEPVVYSNNGNNKM